MKRIIYLLHQRSLLWAAVLLLSGITGCKKFVEVDAPFTSINSENVFTDDETAVSAVTSVYSEMSSPGMFTGGTSISIHAGLSSDEIKLIDGITDNKYLAYFQNNLLSNRTASFGQETWVSLYTLIYNCNLALEKLAVSTSLTPAVKEQLTGEMKFMRAFFFFYLVNFYGDIPMPLVSDYAITSKLPRTAVDKVYEQIVIDLKDAQQQLNTMYVNQKMVPYDSPAQTERVRPNSWTATALLARVYLYKKEYGNAEIEASKIIAKTDLFSLKSTLNAVFLKNTTEAIWQLQSVRNDRNTDEARIFVLSSAQPPSTGSGTERPVELSSFQVGAFESGDLRSTEWVGTYVAPDAKVYKFPNKYKNISSAITEYLTLFRLAELFLVRAEAKAHASDLTGAMADIDALRVRANLPLISSRVPSPGKDELLSIILHERRVELFSEFGHRWLDLKRTGQTDAVMGIVTPLKGGTWQPSDKLYPIWFQDITRNPNLTQNPGY